MSQSILQENVASPETPGSKHFPPFEPDAALEAEADRRVAQFPDEYKRSAVLPILHHIQHKHGFISDEAIRWTAGRLELEPIQVTEVVTFYPGFRQSAPGKYHIRVCKTLSCAMGGAFELMDRLCEITGIPRESFNPDKHPFAVSACGTWSVEFAECLASCGTAPVCMVNDDFHEEVAPESADGLLKKYSTES